VDNKQRGGGLEMNERELRRNREENGGEKKAKRSRLSIKKGRRKELYIAYLRRTRRRKKVLFDRSGRAP